MIAPQYISDWEVWFNYFHTYGSFCNLEKSMMVSRAKIFSCFGTIKHTLQIDKIWL